MMTVNRALELAAKYEALGKDEVAAVYLRQAERIEAAEKSGRYVKNLRASSEAIKSATRSVTGSIHC